MVLCHGPLPMCYSSALHGTRRSGSYLPNGYLGLYLVHPGVPRCSLVHPFVIYTGLTTSRVGIKLTCRRTPFLIKSFFAFDMHLNS